MIGTSAKGSSFAVPLLNNLTDMLSDAGSGKWHVLYASHIHAGMVFQGWFLSTMV
jgi:hypothetical protein